jgi:hypothetical protein
MNRRTVRLLTVTAMIVLCAATVARGAALIIDHTCCDIDQVPPVWVEQAKADLRLCYGHTSHGSQLVSGMTVLENDAGYGDLFAFNTSGAIEPGVLSLDDNTPSGDLGNPDRTTWASRTRAHLDGAGSDRNVVIWSWCGQADTSAANIDLYLGLMDQLEQDYPGVTFVYMTGHLNGTGEEGNLFQCNNQIRAFCQANDKVLFDFADIESYDPDGEYFRDRYANDNCDYAGGNWAVEWCAANPGECASCSCAHSQCLNCQQKGKAVWWMLACLAGWEPEGLATVGAGLDCEPAAAPLPFTLDIAATLANLLDDEARVVAGTIAVTTAGGAHYPQWRSGSASLSAGQTLTTAWRQSIPAQAGLMGPNAFVLSVEDVTPAPFNQPPYAPSGDTATAGCTVTGLK